MLFKFWLTFSRPTKPRPMQRLFHSEAGRSTAEFLGCVTALLLVSGLWSAQMGCASGSQTLSVRRDVDSTAPLDFSFATPRGELVTSESLRGRVTVLLFVTTFDVGSQAQAKRLEDLFRTHAPRLNALGVVLEAPRYAELAGAYASTVGLNYPIVMADQLTLSGEGQFGRVDSVPTWVFLDRKGRLKVVFRGPLLPRELEEIVQGLQ